MMKQLWKKIVDPHGDRIQRQLTTNAMLLGDILSRKVKELKAGVKLSETEFKVFSQWGEDGILQYILSKIDVPKKIFVEFGVENYCEANTRFLLMHDNYSGLVLDGSQANVDFIRNDEIYWRHALEAKCAFITRENINDLIRSAGIGGDIAILSVDIDGNDYWVWEQIDAISPRLVVCEYNSVFGSKHAVTVPYDPRFYRTIKHYSNLYFGASLKALCLLAEKKGYDFIGSNSAGVNAFFIRKDLSKPFIKYSVEEGYALSKTRESRNKQGDLTFLTDEKKIELIRDMPVWNIEQQRQHPISEIMNADI